MPKGWITVRIKDVSEVVTGSTPSKIDLTFYNGPYPFYKPTDLDVGRHVTTSNESLSLKGFEASRKVPKNSIAICCIGSIGKVGFLEKEGATNQQINTLIPSEVVNPLYLYYVAQSNIFKDQLLSEASAVTIAIVNKSKVNEIVIPLPPINEQKRITDCIEKLFNGLNTIISEL